MGSAATILELSEMSPSSLKGTLKSTLIKAFLPEKEISVIDFDHSDVVRHPLVSKIVKAYSNHND